MSRLHWITCPGCRRHRQMQFARGYCHQCYNRFLWLVRSGKTTWDELENFNRVSVPELGRKQLQAPRGACQ